MTKKEVAALIDHTQLSACATEKDIELLCAQAKENSFASVCVNPCFVPLAASLLSGSEVKVCTVIGFPLGADSSADKAFQSAHTIGEGADEVDMVIALGSAKAHQWQNVEDDIRSVVVSSREAGIKADKQVIVKVILETCYLTDEEVVECCNCAVRAGADFVKTSTGFGTPKDSAGKPLFNGATVHHVSLMRKTVGPAFGVKASGGIHSAEEARKLIEAGASRIGASSGIAIISSWKE